MKTVILASVASAVCLFTSCTTHVYPKTTSTVYRTTPSYTSSPAARISADTPDNTTVVRPAE